ncbi:hypothetical protein JTB14_013276 [Gonioctena quinquepunctata]|nr:hypothetical protein JTB14_013276 [Gonioctena quinquepunctata]
MSKNSTARFSSEGDADSNFAEVSPNARSRCSSYKSRKDLEGGPYGDCPSDPAEQAYKNCVFYMIQENEDSTGTPEDSEGDQELYSLRNDYLEKLNIVRRRLNLVEITDDGDNQCSRNQGGCIITELQDGETPRKTDFHKARGSGKQTLPSEPSSDKSDSFELKTIHPFSVGYNMNQSISNLLEMEYNPPKKKSCLRLRTPKLPSSSESNIPYHTKVSLHEDLFKKSEESKETASQVLSRKYLEKFTMTKETQCSDQEMDEPEIEVETKRSVEKNVNLFPQVIVLTDTSSVASTGASDKTPSGYKVKMNPTKKSDGYPLNFIEEASGESNDSVTTNTTIIDSLSGKIYKRGFGKKGKHASTVKMDFREQLKEMGNDHIERGGGENICIGKPATVPKPSKHDTVQFMSYRKEQCRPKSSPIKRKHTVPFGPLILNNFDKTQILDNKFYFFSSSVSDEDRYIVGLYGGTSDSNDTERKTGSFWTSLFSCFRPIFNFIARR